MSFRAKVRITGVKGDLHNAKGPRTVTMQPVFSNKDGDANKEWSKYTPSGAIELVISNENIFDELVVGKCLFADFSPAPEAE